MPTTPDTPRLDVTYANPLERGNLDGEPCVEEKDIGHGVRPASGSSIVFNSAQGLSSSCLWPGTLQVSRVLGSYMKWCRHVSLRNGDTTEKRTWNLLPYASPMLGGLTFQKIRHERGSGDPNCGRHCSQGKQRSGWHVVKTRFSAKRHTTES
jgi:hypothetical protein